MFKRSLVVIFSLFFSSRIQAQDITGLWRGTLYNDTTQRYLKYEIAISEHKGKLYGYTHTFFIVDDREYYGVKKVSVRKMDDKYVLQTEELVANNYPNGPQKGIKQVDVLTFDQHDNIMTLSGPFHTIRTKTYSSLTGSIKVERKSDYRQSALVPHLEELGLAKDLSFVESEVAVAEPVATVGAVDKPVFDKKETVSVATNNKIVVKTAPKFKGPASDVASRKIETIQSVYFKSDSLELTLYDNGEVDGDTVSVLMNGVVIMPMVGLSTRAIKKTIYITKETPDSLQLIMYAENLGSIPPNTGLLVVHDGQDVYEIRFSGDLNKNAAIVFKRRK